MQKLNNILLNNQQVKEEITKKIRKHLQKDSNENTTYQNLQDEVKGMVTRKFIEVNAYIKKRGSFQINNLTLQCRKT